MRDETADDAMATPMEAFAAMQRKLREDSKTYESLSEGACDSTTTTTDGWMDGWMWTMDEEGSLSVSVVKIERTNPKERRRGW